MAQPEQGRVAIVIEKPFGHDLDSARDLNHKVNAVFNESQVFRIDHYLGKETVQNLLVFRFANGDSSETRSGNAITLTMYRSPWPKPSASRAAAHSTRRPARCATWSRTT